MSAPPIQRLGLFKRDPGTPGPVGGALPLTGRCQNPSLKTRGAPTLDRGPGGGFAGEERGWRSAEAAALGARNPRHGIREVMEGLGR